MSEDEEDYLSDKFLVNVGVQSTAPKTYAQIRKEAQRKAEFKSQQNRIKGRRQREIESREEGLNKSLFTRAKEEQDAGISSGNKALSIMMKMGFKPGHALGLSEESAESSSSRGGAGDKGKASEERQPIPETKSRHVVEPVKLKEWEGRKGIGVNKRSRSPAASDRLAKMAKMEEESSREDFRDRAKREYEERRAEARLVTAQRTCMTLDEEADKTYNVLWLNPNNADTFPPDLMDALSSFGYLNASKTQANHGDALETRLRQQMHADALQPMGDPEASLTETNDSAINAPQTDVETIQEAAQFLRLRAQDRLQLVLSYLRDKYFYCFWCGLQYATREEMDAQCPGVDEDSHD